MLERFAIDDSFPVVLRQDAKFTLLLLFLLQLASMCVLTICWGHVGIEAAKPENPEYPSSSLSLATCHSLAPTGKASSSIWE